MTTEKRKQKIVPKIGQKVECSCYRSKRVTSWLYPFVGYIEKIYERTALVVIQSTHKIDDYLVDELRGRTIVPFDEMKVLDDGR